LSLAVYPEECGNAPVDYKMPAMVAILTACHCLQATTKLIDKWHGRKSPTAGWV